MYSIATVVKVSANEAQDFNKSETLNFRTHGGHWLI